MNRINRLLQKKASGLVSIYFTAGYPSLSDTLPVIAALDEAGADLIEIGIPFSDPVADGPALQHSNKVALDNGMTLQKLFEQLQPVRGVTSMPIVLMGYINPILRFGFEEFCVRAEACGVDGLIIPDLPLRESITHYQQIASEYGLELIFLVTPGSSEARIREIDAATNSFLYMVTSAGTTGSREGFDESALQYFRRMRDLKLKNPLIAGFGISTRAQIDALKPYCAGAIIGSSFVKALRKDDIKPSIQEFLQPLL